MRLAPLLLLFVLTSPLHAAPISALPGLPAPPIPRKPADLRDARIASFQAKINRANIFAAYDALSAIYKQAGLFDNAAALERQQAPLYRRKKLEDAAIIHENNAAALENQLQIFADVTVTAQGVGKLFTGASLEPILGCYSGAFIDCDETLGPPAFSENWQGHRSPEQFQAKSGRLPGSLFIYLKYGQPFPSQWVAALKAANTVPHIAWEPTDLTKVQDDQYLNDFALAAREADWPVFIRFASEMNGFWTPYHGNPKLYRQKFRLVNSVLHRHAPRIATIWCVNNPPLGNAMDYYPGDDGCDWVGVNFYSVPFHENRRDKPAFDETPLALLAPIYARFAAKKPIAICEFAASHQSVVDKKQIPAFTIDKISQLYGALPLLYPRVKMINWFDMNTIKHPTPGKTLNDYLLTENQSVLKAWRDATGSPHFLTSYARLGDPLPPLARPLDGQKLSGKVRCHIWAKTYGKSSHLFVALDNKIIYKGLKNGSHTLDLDVTTAKKGRHTLTAYLYDDKNRFQRQSNAAFTVQ